MMVRVTDVPIVFSPAGRQALVERGLFENVVEVPLGTIGVTEITDEEIAHVRDLYEIRKPLVLTLGFTTVDKGVDVLLDAASEIAEMRSNDVQFLIAGKPRRRRGIFRVMERPDVKCQQRLETQANQLENVDIAFTDFVANADVAALLHTADVVVLPYRRITQSGVANLTLSSRSVVVCSDLPGLRSDLGNSAKYVAVGDPKALAEQVVSLLDEDGRLTRSHMRELSGKCASENTFAKVAESILAAGLAHRESETTTS
jgi:glycosyltransferase involved in cell wall biosynthesis